MTTLKTMLLHLDNAPARNSRLSSENIESAKAQRVPHPPLTQTQHQVTSSSLVLWMKNSAVPRSLRATIESLRGGKFSLKLQKWD
jgi:hypothetical protein